MKRTVPDSPVAGDDPKMKKLKQDEYSKAEEEPTQTGFVNLDENLLFEVLKRVDAKTLATAACVSKQWNKTSQDGRLWAFKNLDENLLFEVLKHVDAKTLATAACVSKQWHKTAQDERLWELICTRHWANVGCGIAQLRSVVLALGGFRQLHAKFLSQLSRPPPQSSASASSSSSSDWAPFQRMVGSRQPARWGKDEVQLSLSLLSIHFFTRR